MEVAAGDAFHGIFKDNRVVSNRIDFNFNFLFDEVDRILACTVNLRNTTQGLWILDTLLSSYCRIATAF